MNIFKLANVMDKKMSPLQIEANLCTKIISHKSECHSCMEHCPTKSISIEKNEIVIDEHCLECGLCTTLCPTNAIYTQRPSLNQWISDTISTCKQNEKVYLHCDKVTLPAQDAVSVKISCLGGIPREAWLAISGECSGQLSIYHPADICQGCEISCGESVWRKEMQQGEAMSSRQLQITSTIEQPKQPAQYDQKRRAFFSSLFSEVKATHKLAVKEWLADDKVQTYQDKMKNDPVLRLEREWQNIANDVVEKITDEATYPYMTKRKVLLAEVRKNEALQSRCDIRLPEISPDCTLCGACALLCPTNALVLTRGEESESITLHPSRCVDCHLCEEICYFKSITLKNVANGGLLGGPTTLIKRSEG
ncbi:4Fe-4S binding protein [Bacillus sp. FJAT-27251]|uniref:4Fe-4S binding protein n=1 Tax=Bacillus sp. FJAT-27251 TaxID=1684142 RepID=UPI0006A7D4C9|nr:4Fe-4S binding protein [Bacillus sp. FJAT-27251]